MDAYFLSLTVILALWASQRRGDPWVESNIPKIATAIADENNQ